MKIDIIKKTDSKHSRDIFVKLDNDNSVHYKVSVYWCAYGYVMKAWDCFCHDTDPNGFTKTTYNSMFCSIKPTLLQAKTTGYSRFSKKALDTLTADFLDVKNDVFIFTLNAAVDNYKNNGIPYAA